MENTKEFTVKMLLDAMDPDRKSESYIRIMNKDGNVEVRAMCKSAIWSVFEKQFVRSIFVQDNEICIRLEDSSSGEKVPVERFRYTVRNPEESKKEEIVELPEKVEKKYNLYKSYSHKKTAKAIQERISDEQADEWIKEQNNRVRSIVAKEELPSFVAVLKRIYGKMTREYGFVAMQLRKEVMDEYQLTDEPSILRCIAQDETWKVIFENIITSIECNGYLQTVEG